MPARILSKEELIDKGYEDLVDLCDIFQHDAVEEENGIWRWKTNAMMDFIYYNAPLCDSKSKVSVNTLWMRVRTVDDILQIMKFYMQIGMSLSGFIDVFGQRTSVDFGLPDAVPINEEEDDWGETLLKYVAKHFKGKIARSL